MKVSNYCTNTYCRVRNLTVNKEYDFRVYAENHYGVSDPGMNEDGIKVWLHHQYCKLKGCVGRPTFPVDAAPLPWMSAL